MLRRLTIVTALAAGMCITAAITLAPPALAKGPSQARIIGLGLAHGLVVTGNGEPGQLSALADLAQQTELFTVLFGPGGSLPGPNRLPTPPPVPSRGARYIVTYTVPGVTPQHGERYGRVRQVLYPLAKGGPVIYTPPGQLGFGHPLQVTGWMRGSPRLASVLAKLGVPPRPHGGQRHASAAHLAAARRDGGQALAWLAGSLVAISAAAIATLAWRLRHRPPTGGAA